MRALVRRLIGAMSGRMTGRGDEGAGERGGRKKGGTYLRRVIRIAIRPNEIEIVPELALRLVCLLLHFLQHRLHVHRICYHCTGRVC